MKRFDAITFLLLSLPAVILVAVALRPLIIPSRPHIEILENRVHRLEGKAIEHSIAIRSNPDPWWVWGGKTEARIMGSRCYDFRGREIITRFSGADDQTDLLKPTSKVLYNTEPILRQVNDVTFRCWISWKEKDRRRSKTFNLTVAPQSLVK